ncbi:MAG: hypothetical protein OJI67_18055 [Prosthecobacter sp.]|nr:hypothetical protein [Prosthecobacter sp.]
MFVVSAADVLISYFANVFHVSIFQRPWVALLLLLLLGIAFDLKTFSRLFGLYTACFFGLVFCLGFGAATVPHPGTAVSTQLDAMQMKDLVTVSTAYLIGAMCALKLRDDGHLLSGTFLALTAVHAIVCIIALSSIAPDLFPVLDKPYYNDGRLVSRPEITTDQTRQVFYLFGCLFTIFTSKSLLRLLISVGICIAIAFIVAKVQSRWGALTFALFAAFAYFLGLFYGVQRRVSVLGVIAVGAITITWFHAAITAFLGDLLWRFAQVDLNLGGRAPSILYLFEKLADPSYWLPKGYGEFYAIYGAAPHSFPTMIYLYGGIIGLMLYGILLVGPLWQLGKLVFSRRADSIQRIAFFSSSFAFALLMTQPVISHEIFWLFTGFSVGVICRTSYQRTPVRGVAVSPAKSVQQTRIPQNIMM